ncbi:MAG: PKD domain-containing protein [Bacteroidota bacterium]
MKKQIATLICCCISSFWLHSQCTFSIDPSPICGGAQVTFELNGNPSPALTYNWNFGDGSNTTTGSEVAHFFPSQNANTAYVVVLTVQDGAGNVVCTQTTPVTVLATPVPSLEDINFDPFSGLGVFTFCGSSPNDADYLIEFNNTSEVQSDIVNYTIDWGDNTPDFNGNNANFPSSHLYTEQGAFNLVMTATHVNGCVGTVLYQVFNGANPSLTGGTPGGTTGLCAPSTLDFSLGGTENNSPGTEYRVVINGEEVQQFVQQPGDEPLTNLEILFDTTSCGVTSQGGFSNSFDVRLEASNACGQTAVTIEPIEMGAPPDAMIGQSGSGVICGGDAITFVNATTGAAFINNGNCVEVVTVAWEINPPSGWTIISGALDEEELEVQFDVPGNYTVSLTATNPCGSSTTTENVQVLEPLEAIVDLSGNNLGCVPSVLTLVNNSSGANANNSWSITPITGWAFVGNTDANSREPEIQFFFPGEYDISLEIENVCGTDTWDTTLVLVGVPMVELPNPVADACESITLDFSGSNVDFNENGSQNATYEWNFPGGTPASSTEQFPTGITYMPTVSTEYIYEVTITNECGTATAADTFFVQVPGSLDLIDDFEICTNEETVPLTATPGGGTWSGDGVTSDGIFDPSEAAIGENILTYNVGQGLCQSEASITVTVIQAPAANILSVDNACESESSITLEAEPLGGTWSSEDGGVINGNSFDPSASGAGTFTLTYTYTDPATSCVAATDQSFTVNELPVLQTEDVTFCIVDEDLDLPAASPSGGDWSGSGIIDGTAGTFNPTTAGGIGNYPIEYTFTDGNGCTNIDTFTVQVIELDMVNAGMDTSLCNSVSAYDLSLGSMPTLGTWSIPGGVGLSGSVFDASQLTPDTYELTFTVGEGSCQVQDALMVEVLPLPTIDLDANADGACISVDQVILEAEPVGGSWSVDNGGDLSGNVFSPSASGVASYNLEYTFVDANSCENRAVLPFEVFPLPDISVNDTIYCSTPGTVELPVADPAGGTWVGTGVLGTTFNPIIAGGVGTYTLEYTFVDGNGCTDSRMVDITVEDPVEVEAGVNDTLCSYDPAFQLVGFEPMGLGTWTGTGITDAMGMFDPAQADPGVNVLTYTVGNGNCLVSDQIEIFVVDLSGTTAGPDEEVCLSASPFPLSGNDPLNGTWSGPGITNANLGLFDPEVAGVGTHEITYTFASSFSNCDAVATKMVTVHPMPESAFSLPAEACLNQDIVFTNESVSTDNPFWDFGDETTSTDINPTHTYDAIGTYTITLVSTNTFGCVDSTSQTVFITEPPTAEFAPSIEEGCAVLGVDFDNQSTGFEIAYDWDFGNGDTSSLADPGTIFYEQGLMDTTYVVRLEVTNLCATRIIEDTITVFPLPLAGFGVSIDTSCTPMEVSFGNVTLGNPESFDWDFGNTATSTAQNPPMQTYFTDTTSTEYTITLIATNFCGADTATQQIVVNPVDVEAFFNIPANEGCEPYVLPFTSFATPGALVTWDFGDGNTSSETNPIHTFDSTGIYEVVQYATNGCGFDSIATEVTVLPAPEVDFAIVKDRVCRGDTVFFENLSINTAGNFWDFANGDTSVLNNPTTVYDSAGVFTVQLVGISAENGCPAFAERQVTILPLPEASFDPSTIDGCAPLTVEFENTSVNSVFYEWDFGDNNTSSLENPVHTFDTAAAYVVQLLVTDQEGCRDDTVFFSITAHPNPIAAFDLERSQLCGIPVEVAFENNSEGAVGFEWSFGDGEMSLLNEPIYAYQDTGSYAIQLVASNEFNCTDTTVQSIRALPVPNAAFGLDPQLGCVPDSISFFNNSTFANQYVWRFGDGQSSTAINPIHTYTEAGFFDVTLVASYDSICFDSIELIDAVEMLLSPTASFEFRDLPGTPAGAIDFINTSENALSYFWDFGDGATSTEENPDHRYEENNVWQVFLEATGANGCVDDTIVTVQPIFFKGLWIPTGLTPESGIGDTRLFKPAGAGLEEYHVQVFSQHGELIWESELLEDGRPVEAWDGTLNGEIVPQDVYVWKAFGVFEDGTVWPGMRLKSGRLVTSGTLMVIR